MGFLKILSRLEPDRARCGLGNDTDGARGARSAEFLPFQLSRIDSRFGVLDLEHPPHKLPSEYFRTNIAITTTGVFSHAALIAAIGEVGADNVMFSIDYPFESTEKAVQFIRTAPLAPADQARVAHVNAERLLRLNQ